MSVPAKYQTPVLAALAQAYAAPGEVSLHASRGVRGLFPANAAGKAAAQATLQAGFLESVRTEVRGKTTQQFVVLTESGSAYLVKQSDPKPLLDEVQGVLQSQKAAMQQLQTEIRTVFENMTKLQARVEQLSAMVSERDIVQTRISVSSWEDQMTEYLCRRQAVRPAEDCPLPELYREARNVAPGLSVGTFHDGLRRLQSARRITLQPWTGPLHELPEPTLALLQGHSLAFYASAMEM